MFPKMLALSEGGGLLHARTSFGGFGDVFQAMLPAQPSIGPCPLVQVTKSSQNPGIARIGLTPILPSIALSNIKYGTTLYYIIVVSNVYFYTPPVVLQKKYSILPSHVFCKYVCCHI